MSGETPPRHFFAALESLRGMAAIVVLLWHIAWAYPFQNSFLIRNGTLMVDFFFVLSGFVISHAYSGTFDSWQAIAKFMWLRLARLYPLHVTMLCVFLGIELAKYAAEVQFGLTANKKAFSSNTISSFASNVFLVQSLGLHDRPTFNLPAWSISTEFYTYLLFSVVSCIFKTRWAMLSAAIIIAAASFSLESQEFERIFLRCVTGFFVGTVAYQIYGAINGRLLPTQSRTMSEAPVLLSLAATLLLLSHQSTSGMRVALLVAFACLIISIAFNTNSLFSRLLTATPFVYLGQLSYSIYMTHSAVIWVLSQILRVAMGVPQVSDEHGDPLLTPAPLIGISFLAMTILFVVSLSHYTYKLIEDPFRHRSKVMAGKWFRHIR